MMKTITVFIVMMVFNGCSFSQQTELSKNGWEPINTQDIKESIK